MSVMVRLLKSFWDYLREVSGENDYGRYRTKMFIEGCDAVSRREFYDQRQQEKYSRPNRCC